MGQPIRVTLSGDRSGDFVVTEDPDGALTVAPIRPIETQMVEEPEMAPLPEGWGQTLTGEPLPNVVAAVRRSRNER